MIKITWISEKWENTQNFTSFAQVVTMLNNVSFIEKTTLLQVCDAVANLKNPCFVLHTVAGDEIHAHITTI